MQQAPTNATVAHMVRQFCAASAGAKNKACPAQNPQKTSTINSVFIASPTLMNLEHNTKPALGGLAIAIGGISRTTQLHYS